MGTIAIVILNWNGRDMLRRFLPAVLSCSDEPGTEVWVADNGSTDGSAEVVEAEFPAVRVLRLDCNYGFAEGYNRALREVEADYAVLLNSDVEPTPGWLRPLAEYMDAHPEAAACQPKILSYHQKDHFEYAGACGGFIDHYGYPFCRGRLMDTVERDLGQYDTPAAVAWTTGAAMFVRLADYCGVGGLDGRFFAHMEEIDLCWRLRSRGRELACVPRSVVYHVGGATLAKGSPKKTFLNFRNNLLMLYKNLPPAELRPVMRVRLLLDWLAAVAFLAQGRVGDFRAVLRARREYRRMLPDFRQAREENLRAARAADAGCRTSFCLLWQYYVRGRKYYSSLPSR